MTDENSFGNSMSKNWPRWRDKAFVAATALFFFLLPIQMRFIFRETPFYEYGTLSVFLVEVLGWVVIGLGAIKIKNVKLKIKNVWLLSLPFLAFVSIVWAADKAMALQAAVRLLEGVLLYVVLRNFIAPTPSTPPSGMGGNDPISPPFEGGARGGLQWCMYAFLAGAVIQAGLGIYQFLTQSSFASTLLGMALHDPRALGTAVVEFSDERWLRAYGGLPHPNVLGGYLVVALIVCYARLQEVTEGYKRLLLQTLIPILITGIFFTFSRAAWIATLLVLLWAIICEMCCGKKRTVVAFLPQRIGAVLMIFYVGALLIVFRPLVATRLHGDSRLEVKSRVERISGLRESWDIIKRHPIFGVGIGNYTQARQNLDAERGNLGGRAVALKPLYTYQPVHNVPLLVWTELGIVGLALWLMILLYLLQGVRSFTPFRMTLGVLLLFDHYLWTLPFGILLFWTVLGLSTHKPQANT